MAVYLSKDGLYLINDVDRRRKRFSPKQYFIFDNAWYEYCRKYRREPTFSEFQQYCCRSALAGYVSYGGSRRSTTFPDDSVRGVYGRLCNVKDSIIREAVGTKGKCAPRNVYRDERNPFASRQADAMRRKKVKEAEEKAGIEKRMSQSKKGGI